jgi:hypothetical protein
MSREWKVEPITFCHELPPGIRFALGCNGLNAARHIDSDLSRVPVKLSDKI